MVTDEQVTVLKQIAFALDALHKFRTNEIDNYSFRINQEIPSEHHIRYTLHVLKMKCNDYCDENAAIDELVKIGIGFEVDVYTTWFLVYLFNEIIGREKCVFYISYATHVYNWSQESNFGRMITIGSSFEDDNTTNISKFFPAEEILRLDMSWTSRLGLENHFPNANPTGGKFGRTSAIIHGGYTDDPNFGENQYKTSKHNNYNGWSDDAIDDAFEGDAANTWNVD